MALVDPATFSRLTGDTVTSADAAATAIAEAQELIEDYLRRPLESMERTERLKVYGDDEFSSGPVGGYWGYRVYPSATPITAVDAAYEIQGEAITGVNPTPDYLIDWSPNFPLHTTVTYTGGFTADTCPNSIKRAIARTAWLGIHSPALTSSIPVGAKLVKVGDAAVGFGPGGAGAGGVSLDDAVRALVAPYRRRLM